MTHDAFRVFNRYGKQVDVVTKAPLGGYRSAKTGLTATRTATILGWHGRRARLAALVAEIEGPKGRDQ